MKDKKAIIMSTSIVLILLVVLGISYAFFTYENGERSEIVTGQIYMNYEETTNISLTNVWPETKAQALARTDENGVFEFTITGQNTSRYPIYYEVDLLEGGVITGKTEQSTKILPEHVMVYLERDGEVLVDGVSYADWNNKRIYIDTIPANTPSVTHNYSLRIWISENVTISDTNPNADYTTSEWNDSYTSLKVRVVGDFEEKTMPTLSETVIASLGTNGLVAVADDGTLYTDEETQTIREYRYSGSGKNSCEYTYNGNTYMLETSETSCPNACYYEHPEYGSDIVNSEGYPCYDGGIELSSDEPFAQNSVKNYVSFNGELWRIIGVFPTENEDGTTENLVKIVKDEPLTAEEIPMTYTYNGVEMTLREYDEDRAVWNKTQYFGQTNSNDWTQAALQYYLNDETEGSPSYYNSIAPTYQGMINETIYNLGNVRLNSNASKSYIDERSAQTTSGETIVDNLHEGNSLYWNGKIGLAYPSDYGYAADSVNWETSMFDYTESGWLPSSSEYVWTISPTANSTDEVVVFVSNLYENYTRNASPILPVLYLKSDIKITGGDGSGGSPYQLG